MGPLRWLIASNLMERTPCVLIAEDYPRASGADLAQYENCSADMGLPRVCGADVTIEPTQYLVSPTTPRVRGRLGLRGARGRGAGTTPACAEQTLARINEPSAFRDYPRVCGADQDDGKTAMAMQGLPPRVRGRPERWQNGHGHAGTTPACAGQTQRANSQEILTRDYPRVCGADSATWWPQSWGWGLPPRVRGRLPDKVLVGPVLGTTPACAGQTSLAARPQVNTRDYPRVCGADPWAIPGQWHWVGLPPRVRGRPERPTRPAMPGGDYPRVCGADFMPLVCNAISKGLPPRVRGRPPWNIAGIRTPGTTPACAGQTSSPFFPTSAPRDYPRVCGADPPHIEVARGT